jgi:hypothetical protein
MLRLANAAVFNTPGRPVTGLPIAIARHCFGFERCADLPFMLQQMRLVDGDSVLRPQLPELWRKGALVAPNGYIVTRETPGTARPGNRRPAPARNRRSSGGKSSIAVPIAAASLEPCVCRRELIDASITAAAPRRRQSYSAESCDRALAATAPHTRGLSVALAACMASRARSGRALARLAPGL